MRFGDRRLWAIFEPRSATSRRNTFQQQFAESFDHADIVVIAPAFNQSGIPKEDRLNVHQLVSDLRARGKEAFCWGEAPLGKAIGMLQNLPQHLRTVSQPTHNRKIWLRYCPMAVLEVCTKGFLNKLTKQIII